MFVIDSIPFLITFICAITSLDLNNLDLKTKQKYVLLLLNHITEPTIYEEIKNISNNFSIDNHAELYSKMEDVRTFSAMKKKGMFDRGDVFCLFCEKPATAAAVFRILHGSKDFSTFITTSCWLRQEINEMLFLYTFSTALRHRTDCYRLMIPPIYETYPFFYVPKKTQQSIFVAAMTSSNDLETFKDKDANLKTDRYSTNYFTEDIGLNSFYYNFHLDYPFWMTDDVYGLNIDRRGELYIYLHNQLLARYNLERLSHMLCEIEAFNPTQIIETKLEGSLMFHNGWTLPDSHGHFNLLKEKYELVKDLEYLEYQIREAAYTGFYNSYDGSKLETTHKGVLEALGRRVYGNSRKSNEMPEHDIAYITRALFSSATRNVKSVKNPTSTMQFYETSLRNPIFWTLQKYFMILISKVKEKKPYYRRENLYFYGIDILKMTVSRLVTHFSPVTIDISNIFLSPDPQSKKQLLYQHLQLDHTPFNITLKVHSEKPVDIVVRIYLRPAQDCEENYLETEDNFDSFIEIDAFISKLYVGNNTVVRQSSEMNNFTPIQNITDEMKRKIETNNLNVTEYRNSFTGLPTNLILPRGSKYGLRLQMFAIVSPLEHKYLWENNVEHYKRKGLCRYTFCIDERPLGFPFDSKWEAGVIFYPNMKLIDVFVYHKKKHTTGLTLTF